MKLQLFVVLLAVAGSYALPRANELVEPRNVRNNVENRIRRFIERVIVRIANVGDPFEVQRRDFKVNITVVNLAVEAFVANSRFSGASDIRINNLEYSYLNNRLRLDLSLPDLSLVVGDSGLDVNANGKELKGQLKGSLSVKSIRIAGEGYIDVSWTGEISLRSISINFSVGDIRSDLNIVAQGNDHSDLVNQVLNVRIPNFLEQNKNVINRSLEEIFSSIMNLIWGW